MDLTVVKLFRDIILVCGGGILVLFAGTFQSTELLLLLHLLLLPLAELSPKARALAKADALGVRFVVDPPKEETALAVVDMPIQLNKQRLFLQTQFPLL